MKKTLFVVALATMLIFAVVGSAFATEAINHSGQLRLGTAANAPAQVTSGGVEMTVDGAGTNTYMDWSKTLGANSGPDGGNSPHGSYTTTTVKCVVCHAIHYAAPGKAPVGDSDSQADTLLRMKATQACVYCHATTGMAVNGRPVYNGLGDAIVGEGNTGGNTDKGHYTSNLCSECHTNVHGANADASVASLNGYLLRLFPESTMTVPLGPGAGAATTTATKRNMIDAIDNINTGAMNQNYDDGAALNGTVGDYADTISDTLREQAVGIFCAECHNGAYATAAPGASTNVLTADTTAYSGHRIAAEATTDWNEDGSKSSATTTGTVAWAAAKNCKSCHDALDNFGYAAFPHAWGLGPADGGARGTKMWLTMAPTQGSTAETIPLGATDLYESTRLQLSDGVCLKCHIASDGSSGVGITF